MKRIIYIVLFSILPILTYAQLEVVGAGEVGIGTTSPDEKLEVVGNIKTEGVTIGKTYASASIVCERTNASACALGAGIQGGLAIDENYHLEFRSNTRAEILDRQVSTGNLLLRFEKNTGWAGFNVGNPASELHVNGSITYNGSLNNASDGRLKTNINNFRYGLDEVLQLNPVSYRYNGKAGLRNAGKDQVGLVAQDLQKVAPELVSTFNYQEEDAETKSVRSEDYLMISESSIKYMLINAVKEQQDIIEAQQDEITDLREEMSEIKEMMQTILNDRNVDVTSQNIELNEGGAYLEQNQPNPFNTNTLIKYYIPDGMSSAVINIFDARGTLIHSESISRRGKGEVQIKAGSIAAGTYSYSLTVDGQILDTKQMIIAK